MVWPLLSVALRLLRPILMFFCLLSLMDFGRRVFYRMIAIHQRNFGQISLHTAKFAPAHGHGAKALMGYGIVSAGRQRTATQNSPYHENKPCHTPSLFKGIQRIGGAGGCEATAGRLRRGDPLPVKADESHEDSFHDVADGFFPSWQPDVFAGDSNISSFLNT